MNVIDVRRSSQHKLQSNEWMGCFSEGAKVFSLSRFCESCEHAPVVFACQTKLEK